METQTNTTTSTAVRPFRVDIPEEAIADLRRRIAATVWPEQGDRRRCFAGRAAGDDSETRALLGHRLRLPEVGGAAQCPPAVPDRDRWAGHPFHSRAFAT